ncbi:MAG TPA: Gfo/Idh/MocA family oxidoreductase [Defluviitoga sp.]|nr:Gfo/Idh/MocA family oxidoreductase [Defluviitoga sp.]HOP25217.1 Gfo/Idh/MocA family oxidoreductase [Defluviitoga sp.]HPZ29310.1 Gfo/Idh/MocA family oxidoreductase [Defluviitoga sp.]HQD63240.1 Gfo/Idh/MocA family oxidoreductase [Defluviitoga sp.]
MKRAFFAVVGARNFAADHIKFIKQLEIENEVRLAGVVIEDKRRNFDIAKELKCEGIEVFESFAELLEEGQKFIDIITLPTAIHTHSEMAIKAMESGYNVLLEKPPAPTIQELDNIIQVEKRTKKFCSIGFHMIHARSIRKLKEIILEGKLGEIKQISCKALWPRYKSYYLRNDWAGKTIYNGHIVLDGPMHNALAHYLNNMLYLLGPSMNESIDLESVRAEFYRAHTYIEAEDTSCLEARTVNGTKVYFYVTHASEGKLDPYMEIEGTKGKAIWDFSENTRILLANDETIEFGKDGVDPHLEVFRVTARKHLGIIDQLYSTPTNSRPFVVAINGAYDSAEKIIPIPEKYVKEFETEEKEYKTVLKGIDEIIEEAFEKKVLFSDLGVEWSVPTKEVNVKNYIFFNPFLKK